MTVLRKLNWECLTQVLVLLTLDGLLFTALISDKMKYYVHPRIERYVWFAVAALLIIVFSILPELFKPKHKINIFPCLILIIPIMTGFTLPATPTGTATIQIGNNVSIVAAQAEDKSSSLQENDFSKVGDSQSNVSSEDQLISNGSDTSEASNDGSQIEDTTTPSKVDSQKPFNADADFITVSDEDYVQWYIDAYTNPEKYDGKTVKIKGIVFKMDDFDKNEFVPARMSMTCCAADLAPYGFMCKSTDVPKWKTDQWVYVTAKIKVEYEPHMEMKLPVLYATEITKAEKPKEELIYLY